MNSLETFGWNGQLYQQWQAIAVEHPHLTPGRVTADFGTSLRLATPEPITAELSGKLAHYSDRQNVPKVGDWVGVHITDNNAVIEIVLPRKGEIARSAAGNKTIKQVIAGHVDIAFVLLALDDDFSVDRLRRYLYQLSINDITPIIVLNKADKTEDLESFTSQLISFDVPVITTTATEGAGISDIVTYIAPGKTAILLGSSGVGKSTLTNQILGEALQKTQAVRESDGTGKHTTVHRELFLLPGGGMLIDTPGIRELQLWGTEEDLEINYDDIVRMEKQCHYNTCQHNGEQGCAIEAALNTNVIERQRYDAYLKMKSELVVLKSRTIAKLKADSASSKRRSQLKDTDDTIKEYRME